MPVGFQCTIVRPVIKIEAAKLPLTVHGLCCNATGDDAILLDRAEELGHQDCFLITKTTAARAVVRCTIELK